MIFVPFTQERFTQVLELDEVQQAMLHNLLMTRRDRFLKLSDDTPPPSSQLQRIADIIRRAETQSKQEPAK
jgi:protein-tyrosine phosphatase